MELAYLKTFCEIVRIGSYTRAAEELGYAQSSLTAQIAKLEELYGAVLLERAGRGMVPTFEGRCLLPYARQLIALSEEARTAVSGGARGSLTIGSIETLAAYYLPHRLYSYRERFPGMQLRIQPGSETGIIAAVMGKTADFGLIFDKPFAAEELIVLPLRQEKLLVVLHPEHPLAQSAAVCPADLGGEPLVLTEDSCTYRQHLLQAMRGSGVMPRIDMELGHLEGIKQAVRHRWGIAFLPEYAVEEELRGGVLAGRPLAGEQETFCIQLIYRRDKPLPQALQQFIAVMRQD